MKPIATILDEVRALDEKATSGPWVVSTDHWGTETRDRERMIVASRDETEVVVVDAEKIYKGQYRPCEEGNFAFIAASRTLMPRLAKALEYLTGYVLDLEEIGNNPEAGKALYKAAAILNGEGEDA